MRGQGKSADDDTRYDGFHEDSATTPRQFSSHLRASLHGAHKPPPLSSALVPRGIRSLFHCAGRQRSEAWLFLFRTALAEDFEQHGVDVLKITRMEKPVEYIRIVAGFMPKELEIMDSRLTDLSDEELDVFLAKLRARLRGAISQDLGDGESQTIN